MRAANDSVARIHHHLYATVNGRFVLEGEQRVVLQWIDSQYSLEAVDHSVHMPDAAYYFRLREQFGQKRSAGSPHAIGIEHNAIVDLEVMIVRVEQSA